MHNGHTPTDVTLMSRACVSAAKRRGQVGLVQGIYVEVADAAGEPLFTPRGRPDAQQHQPEAPTLNNAGTADRARVAFEYQAQRDDELDLKANEILVVYQRY
jgi:hypothetical protein